MSVHNVTGDIGKSIFPIFPVNVPLPADTVAPALDAPTATPAPTSRPPACTQGRGQSKKALAFQYALFPLTFLQVIGRLSFFENYLPHQHEIVG